MRYWLMMIIAFALFSTSASAQISSDRFTNFLDKQPYKIYFWYDSLGGNPYDLNCPVHFQPIRLVPQSAQSGTDTTLLVRTNFQSRARVLYYFVPSSDDQLSDLVLPGKDIQKYSTEKPFAPNRTDALSLQQYIDTTSADISRYNQLLEKARRTRASTVDYISVALFLGTSVFLFADTDFNGRVSGGSVALGSLVTVGGVYAFIHTLSKTSRYDNIMKEVRQLELSLNMRF